ncbi:MAG: F0F1 ATP synthase subunit delta [Hyphomicrobiaceae bacterium]|nr:F0F1 ATP synthase subunit delta [Hyphomicrobiaceae bacterium]
MSVENAITVYWLNGAERRLFKEVEALIVAASEPMIAGVAGRYATALFELARDEKQLDRVDGELYIFVALLDAHEELDQALKSPATTLLEKQNVLRLVLENAGLTGLTANFLALVAKNNRLSAVRDVVRAFNGLLAREKGEVQAQVTSATALSDDHKNELVKTLKATLGQDVTIKTSVDPELLGGLIVKIGSKMIDNSLRTKLNNLHAAMKEVS